MGPRKTEIDFRETTRQLTLFAQRWRSKALVRAYHGDLIPEKIFKRWYLPETLPDVRPKRAMMRGSRDDTHELAAFARRKEISKAYAEEEGEKGMAPVGSLMFREVERRIDTYVRLVLFATQQFTYIMPISGSYFGVVLLTVYTRLVGWSCTDTSS